MRQVSLEFGKRGMSSLRWHHILCDHILARAAVGLLLAAPLCALAQEAAPTAAGIIDSSKAGNAPTLLPNEGMTAVATASGDGGAQTALAAPASVPDQAPISDALPSLDPADRVIAERIRDLLAAKPNGIFADEKEHAAVEAFYQKRNLAPLWLDKGIENARGNAVVARLKQADADGLDPADYKTPVFGFLGPEGLAEAELALTQSMLTYARHVQAGRVPHRLVRVDNIGLPQRAPDPAKVLAAVADAPDAGKALDEFSPPHEAYQRLKAALAELRGKTAGRARDEIAVGPVLSFGRNRPMEDARVPQLRERLGVPGEASDLRYDEKLANAVKGFQRGNGLPATGNLDARTVKKLNPTNDRRIAMVIANMERWRWYPRELRKSRVEVNEPDFTLKVLHEGRQLWTTRVVIGKPNLPSPLLAQQMDSITINPTWKVPPSIVQNEYLPAEAKEPGGMARMGLRVKRVDGEVQITMPPGGQNPLGHIRFNFFNRFTVFQHDTPDQYLFAHVVRAESHGCMRVQDAAKYAEILASIARPEEQWTADKVKSLYAGGAEYEISLGSGPIWIYLTYQTAFIDDAGKLQTRRDLYNLDSRTLAAIKSMRATSNRASEPKAKPAVAAPARVGPAQRRKIAHRAEQVAAYPATFFSSATRYARPQPVRGISRR
ncbi:MAG: murein L,D-transpeptidase [Alphaproteobacteria bacterium]|nr:MAG: murein L,D-transpeptidase [Alphaproteobacteria bacterium]